VSLERADPQGTYLAFVAQAAGERRCEEWKLHGILSLSLKLIKVKRYFNALMHCDGQSAGVPRRLKFPGANRFNRLLIQ
jgi:hypothetical protein